MAQLIPPSLLVTEPLPVPAKATLSFSPRTKFAPSDLSASIASEHGPVPVHAPLQPANTEFASAVSPTVNMVPLK